MKRFCCGVLIAIGMFAASPLASAEPFFLRYDPGYTFPEQEGWQRNTYDPDALLRREADGTFLTVDSSASVSMAESYWTDGPALDTSAGEELRVRWRMQTLQTDDTDHLKSDVTVALSRDNPAWGYLKFWLGPDYVSEGRGEYGYPLQTYFFGAGLHDFELRTFDLMSYALLVDGETAFTGTFHRSAEAGPFRLYFGDAIIGSSSISQWDYVEVAVIPEPSNLCALAATIVVICTGLRRRAA